MVFRTCRNSTLTASLWSRFEPNTYSNLFGALIYNRVHKVRSPFASTFCDLLRNFSFSNETLLARAKVAFRSSAENRSSEPLLGKYREFYSSHMLSFAAFEPCHKQTPLSRFVSTGATGVNTLKLHSVASDVGCLLYLDLHLGSKIEVHCRPLRMSWLFATSRAFPTFGRSALSPYRTAFST